MNGKIMHGKKITVVGAGNVGGLAALRIAEAGLGNVTLIDIAGGIAAGKALDIIDSQELVGKAFSVKGTNDIEALAGSDVIVITAGLARKPGMTREDLANTNAAIIGGICGRIRELAPSAVTIIVTNPLDVMTFFALKALGFPRERVMGMGIGLDASRFASLISDRTGVPATSIKPCVIGTHGEGMLPVPRLTFVEGAPLTSLLSGEQIDDLCRRTVERGKEIVSLLGTGSAFAAPSAAICRIVRACCGGGSAEIGVSVELKGEYGLSSVCLGTPCRIGTHGIEKVIELPLAEEEKKLLVSSAASVRSLIGALKT